MQVRTYLDFAGRCEEAVEFYCKVLDAEVLMLMRFKDNPDTGAANQLVPGTEEKILHVTFRIGDTIVQASDGRCTGEPEFRGFHLLLAVGDRGEAERIFGSLAEGGRVWMPLTETFFSPAFGGLTDRFGISWKVHVAS